MVRVSIPSHYITAPGRAFRVTGDIRPQQSVVQLDDRMIGAVSEEGQPPFSRECAENGDRPFLRNRSMADCSSPSPFTTGC